MKNTFASPKKSCAHEMLTHSQRSDSRPRIDVLLTHVLNTLEIAFVSLQTVLLKGKADAYSIISSFVALCCSQQFPDPVHILLANCCTRQEFYSDTYNDSFFGNRSFHHVSRSRSGCGHRGCVCTCTVTRWHTYRLGRR